MKSLILPLFLIFYSVNIFAQAGFEENVITESQTVNALRYADVFSVDLDGDGDNDIITTSYNQDKLFWFKNLDGLGTFSKEIVISDQLNRVSSSFASDLDNDGDLDLLASTVLDNSIVWFENLDGQGNFGTMQLISNYGFEARFVISFDIDLDGDNDVVAAFGDSGSSDKIVWYENLNGQGSFGSQHLITTNIDYTSSLFAKDIDNDGDMDLVSTSIFDDKVAWYENLNYGFSSQHAINSDATHAEDAFLTDLDGDGDNDVVYNYSYIQYNVIEYCGLSWQENMDGQGAFGPETLVSDNCGFQKLCLDDMDGDGDADIVVSYGVGLVLYKNLDGLGAFGSEYLITNRAVGMEDVYVVDLDNDGDKDVISVSSSDEKLAWYENMDGLGTFGDQRVLYMGKNLDDPNYLEIKDFDNDGDMDILCASRGDGKYSWYENLDGQGSFNDGELIWVASNDKAKRIKMIDVDLDGDLDLITSDYGGGVIAWHENIDGQGTFGDPNVIYSSPTQNNDFDIAIGDIDNNGYPDVIATFRNLSKTFLYKNLNGIFSPQQQLSNSPSPTLISVSDLDNDGDLDFVYNYNYSNSNYNGFAVVENVDGSGSNFSFSYLGPHYRPDSMKLVDLDGDNDTDIVWSSQYKIYKQVNLGGLNYGDEELIYDGPSPVTDIFLVDIDNDGDEDILASAPYAEDLCFILENVDGNGTFGNRREIGVNSSDSFITAGDLNNDGLIDPVTISLDHDKIFWFKNLGVPNKIIGKVQLDVDGNGCDDSDTSISDLMVLSTGATDSFATFTQDDGSFMLHTNVGDYITSLSSSVPPYFSITPNSYSSSFTEFGNVVSGADFCLFALQSVDDLNIVIYPLSTPRPGSNVTYKVIYRNKGTTQLSGNISYEFDSSEMVFLDASEAISSQTLNSLTFDFTNLDPFETRAIYLNFDLFAPPITNIGEEIVSTATINPTLDNLSEDNIFSLYETVVGPYDPNDIQVLEGSEIYYDDVDKYLHYIIRFQNTGTDNAIFIKVQNQLDNKLDWTTMQLESLSHNGRVEITNGTDVEFIFDNINLPDSTSDEPNSHGYIAYKIKPKNDVQVGDIFYNTADIYFDFNTPITTNTVSTEIVENLSVEEFENTLIKVYPNPTIDLLNIDSANHLVSKLKITDINGRLILNKDIDNKTNFSLNLSSLDSGLYFVNIQTNSGIKNVKVVKQ